MKLGKLLKRILLSKYFLLAIPVIMFLVKRAIIHAIAETTGTIVQPTDMEESDDEDIFV